MGLTTTDDSEAAYLESQSDGHSFDDEIEFMWERYESNKRAKVGATISCACCDKWMIKKSYQSQFCSNKGRGNCKDMFWNVATEERRERTRMYA